MRAILAVPEWRDMYFRRLRTLVNDILATGRMEALYDARLGPAQSDGDARLSRPGRTPATRRYATFRTRLFNDIQPPPQRFASDARVPGNQPASPNIVIDEIQHSPTGGDTRRVRRDRQPGLAGHRPLAVDDRPVRSTSPSSPAP